MTDKKYTISSPVKGLVTDFNKINQPENTYTFALNSVNETVDGDVGFLSSELGNDKCINLNINNKEYIPIGHINLLNDEVVLFLCAVDNTNSIIAIQKDCKLQIVVNEGCLNFNTNNQIRGIYKIRKGCNRVIYFVDYNNPDRSIDLDEIINNPTGNKYLDQYGNFDCNLIKLASDFKIPVIDYVSTNKTGGNLKLGVYQFALALGDKNLNFTNWISVTDPVPITDTDFNTTFQTMGGNPLYVNTTQSISLQIQNLDPNYDYIKLAVIETISGVSTPYVVDTLQIYDTTINYTYSGLDYNSATKLTLAEIATPRVVFDTSKTIEQHDQRLIRGNVKEKTFDYANLQRAACLIKTTYTTKPKRYNDVGMSSTSGNYYFDNRSYMRDEIYALGIKAVFTDGTESPVVHIPARKADDNLPTNTDPNVTATLKLSNRNLPNGLWDKSVYTVVASEDVNGEAIAINNSTEVSLNDVEHLGLALGNTVPRWKVFNTALRTYCSNDLMDSAYNTGVFTKGELAYWESTYKYPKLKDCSNKTVFGKFDVNGNLLEDYSDTPIRHHKMPDTTLEPHFLNSNTNNGWIEDDFILPLGLEFDLTQFHQFISNNLAPADLAKIQGYKLVRAKRNNNNKTIIDKGLSFRNMLWYYDKEGSVENSANNFRQFQTNVFNRYLEVLRLGAPDNVNIIGSGLFTVNELSLKSGISITPGTVTQGACLDNLNNDFVQGDIPPAKSFLWYDSYNVSYHGAKSKFNQTNLNSSYLKYEKQLWGKYNFYGPGNKGNHGDDKLLFRFASHFNNLNIDASTNNLINGNYTNNNKYLGTPCLNTTNRVLNKQKYINANTLERSGLATQFANGTQEETYVLELNKKIDNIGVSQSILNDTLTECGSPQDIITQTPGATVDDDPVTDPNSWTSAYYISLKAVNNTIYNQLNSITYYDISNNLIAVGENNRVEFSGDIFISMLSFRKLLLDNNYYDRSEYTNWNTVMSFYGESEVNTALRHMRYGTAQDVSKSKYFPKYGLVYNDMLDLLWKNDLVYQGLSTSTSDPDYVTNIIQANKANINEYFYNNDYSKEQTEKPAFPLPLGYDYCNKCLNKFPHRLVYSQKSYQEELADNYLYTLANSYRDIPANGGEINDLFRKSDELYVKTFQSLWKLETKPQQLQTGTSTIQIGIGDFLSIPPREVNSTKTGFAGGQTRWDLNVNEYGALFADQLQGKVFHFSGELKEISNEGNRNWFEENLPSKLMKLYPNYKYYDSTSSPLGVGLISTYDSRHKRWILTKKEIYPIDTNTTTYTNEKWYHNNTIIPNPYERPDLFQNLSWTLSYDLSEGHWVSYHSYLPNYMYNTQSKFYTNKLGTDFSWEHNTPNYQTFYNIKHPYTFEFVVNDNPLATKTFNSVHYITKVSEYDSTYRQYKDIKYDTFDKALFYNDYQSSGDLTILVKNNNDPFASVKTLFDASQIYSDRNERTWSFNQMRDNTTMVVAEPLFTKDWNNLTYQNQYPIDKVSNINVINYFKSQFEMQKFRDKYLAVRLSYNKPFNRKITTKYLVTQNKDSLR